jgi:cellobiose dehydrogenase (acceptor)
VVAALPSYVEPTIETYNYIVVGAGAGGIVIADKLSESGKSVLLIDRGPPSTYRWGGREYPIRPSWGGVTPNMSLSKGLRPDWLADSNLTRFDVPGLCTRIWVDSSEIACKDVGIMAGCILGGGTAINSGLWFKVPRPKDSLTT